MFRKQTASSERIPGCESIVKIPHSIRMLENNENLSRVQNKEPTDGKKHTISFWARRAFLSTDRTHVVLNVGNTGNDHMYYGFQHNSNKFIIGNDAGAVGIYSKVFNDVSKWHHFVIQYDSTLADANDRCKFYLDGVLQNPETRQWTIPQNNILAVSKNGGTVQIGVRTLNGGTGSNFCGFISHLRFIDGSALPASEFGVYCKTTGTWEPKNYSNKHGYGNNGFFIDFSNAGDLGADASGRVNHFSKTGGIQPFWQIADSPTHAFPLLNPSERKNYNISQSGTRGQTVLASPQSLVTAGLLPTKGKWYLEIMCDLDGQNNADIMFGIAGQAMNANTTAPNHYSGPGGAIVYYGGTGRLIQNGVNISPWGQDYRAGDVIGMALNMDASRISWYKNNVKQGEHAGFNMSGAYKIAFGAGTIKSTQSFVTNFGSDSTFVNRKPAQGRTDQNGFGDFYYTPPAGYLAVSKDNVQSLG